MPLVIRIHSGTRAGSGERFDKPTVVVGRTDTADLRFDPMRELDVSGRHAELRLTADGGYEVADLGSTNGTFVNGSRIEGVRPLKNGDRVKFGGNGPEIEVQFRVTGSGATVKAGSTEERVAIAVKKQTAGLRRMMLGGLAVVVIGLVAAYFIGQRAASAEVERLRQQLAANDARVQSLLNSLPGDTLLGSELVRQLGALRSRLLGASTDQERQQLSGEIAAIESKLSGLVRLDLSTINARNANAVALLISEIKGSRFSGTAFALTPDGLLLTNRHNVRNPESMDTVSRIAIKFRNSGDWLPARLVRISEDPDADLALIQMERQGPYPAVTGLQAHDGNAGEGASVAIIGFPFGFETAQENQPTGNDFIAKTSLNGGTISKRTSSVLQIDSFAGHGSSGSPVFSSSGLVVGVVWGGQAEAGGRIVYAVPPDKVAAFLGPEYQSLIKD